MLSQEVVLHRLSRLEHYIKRLREVSVHSREQYLASEDLQDKAERNLQLAIECLIDIGNHIVSSEKLGPPDTYADIFKMLGKAGIYPPAFGEKLAAMAGFRNILVHDYLSKDPRKVYDNLSLIDDFISFAGYIEAYLQSR